MQEERQRRAFHSGGHGRQTSRSPRVVRRTIVNYIDALYTRLKKLKKEILFIMFIFFFFLLKIHYKHRAAVRYADQSFRSCVRGRQ